MCKKQVVEAQQGAREKRQQTNERCLMALAHHAGIVQKEKNKQTGIPAKSALQRQEKTNED